MSAKGNMWLEIFLSSNIPRGWYLSPHHHHKLSPKRYGMSWIFWQKCQKIRAKYSAEEHELDLWYLEHFLSDLFWINCNKFLRAFYVQNPTSCNLFRSWVPLEVEWDSGQLNFGYVLLLYYHRVCTGPACADQKRCPARRWSLPFMGMRLT